MEIPILSSHLIYIPNTRKPCYLDNRTHISILFDSSLCVYIWLTRTLKERRTPGTLTWILTNDISNISWTTYLHLLCWPIACHFSSNSCPEPKQTGSNWSYRIHFHWLTILQGASGYGLMEERELLLLPMSQSHHQQRGDKRKLPQQWDERNGPIWLASVITYMLWTSRFPSLT